MVTTFRNLIATGLGWRSSAARRLLRERFIREAEHDLERQSVDDSTVSRRAAIARAPGKQPMAGARASPQANPVMRPRSSPPLRGLRAYLHYVFSSRG
jgi:hypothetical protein